MPPVAGPNMRSAGAAPSSVPTRPARCRTTARSRHGPRCFARSHAAAAWRDQADAELALSELSPFSPWRATALVALGVSHQLAGRAAQADAMLAEAAETAAAGARRTFTPWRWPSGRWWRSTIATSHGRAPSSTRRRSLRWRHSCGRRPSRPCSRRWRHAWRSRKAIPPGRGCTWPARRRRYRCSPTRCRGSRCSAGSSSASRIWRWPTRPRCGRCCSRSTTSCTDGRRWARCWSRSTASASRCEGLRWALRTDGLRR